MKLSIWRQFSSNHSAMYTIVGVFPSSDEAKTAGETIRSIVERIAKEAEVTKVTGLVPSNFEIETAALYGFDWKEAVDWLRFFPRHFMQIYIREPIDYIMIAEKLVIVDAPGASSTWQTGHQFVNLINAMGGEAFSIVYNGEDPDGKLAIFSGISVDLTCIAPNEGVAKDVYKAIQLVFERQGRLVWLAWARHVPNYAHYSRFAGIDDFDEVEAQWIKEQNAWSEFYRANPLDLAALKKQAANQHEYGKLEEEKRAELFRQRSKFVTQDAATDDAMNAIYTEAGFSEGTLSIEGTRVELKDADLVIAISAMLQWLRNLGCEVSYQFRQED